MTIKHIGKDVFESFNSVINSCKNPIVDNAIKFWDNDIKKISFDLQVPFDFVVKRVRLHLPNISLSILEKAQFILMPDELNTSIRYSLKNYKEVYQKYLNDSGGYKLLNHFNLKIKGHPNSYVELYNEKINIYFGVVSEYIGEIIETELHYLMSNHEKAFVRYGMFLDGFRWPICYMSFVNIDRFYRIHSLSNCLNQDIIDLQMLNLARVYGFGNLPENSISKLFGHCNSQFKQTDIYYITTAINPLIGFKGTSMLASGFKPFALCPVSYSYDSTDCYIY